MIVPPGRTMKLARTTLRGASITLEPMNVETDAPALFAVTPPGTFDWFLSKPVEWTLPAFTQWLGKMLTRPGSMGFVVRDRAGQVVGSSSYYDTDEAHFMTEIGATWYAQASRGTVVNPECKLLMLAHAFDCGAERVQLKCDGRNVISQRAIAKLGAVREGTLRRHRVNDPERFLRDTVMFSILREEWPGVRAGLEARGARMA